MAEESDHMDEPPQSSDGLPSGSEIGEGDGARRRPSTAWRWILGVIITAVIGSWVSPVGAAIWHGFGDLADGIHDASLGLAEKQADDLDEAIPARSYWVGRPHVIGKSIKFLSHTRNLDLVEAQGATPTALSVAELVRKTPEYAGVPVLLAGRVVDISVRSSDENQDTFAATEATVVSPTRADMAIVGVGGTPSTEGGPSPSIGDVMIFRGVPTATGRIRFSNGVIADSVHFTAVDVEPATLGSAYGPHLSAIVRALEHG
jgi:hypothetical protein